MSYNFENMPPEKFAEILTFGAKQQIQDAVEKELLDSIMPRIKQIAAEAASGAVKNCRVTQYHDPIEGQLKIQISFNGELYER